MLKKHNLYNMQPATLEASTVIPKSIQNVYVLYQSTQNVYVLLQIIYLTVFGSWVFWTTPFSESKVYYYHDTCRQALFMKRFPPESACYFISPKVLLTRMQTCERQMPNALSGKLYQRNLLVRRKPKYGKVFLSKHQFKGASVESSSTISIDLI